MSLCHCWAEVQRYQSELCLYVGDRAPLYQHHVLCAFVIIQRDSHVGQHLLDIGVLGDDPVHKHEATSLQSKQNNTQ
jgi:hypothetical protein